ncbi:uncharacterized protein MONBRDRAFT_37288 [Monosiga brevicollis MX1]|uniref:Nucleotide-diphospho-sugar transferase domain-containing protein n=1 Tax=Monosiga brevicollis TaxID=81824 RepID=A9V0T2_MONBE|nr:uncharacterized protein MONBRDRAFT_37288 [Monosiga brevicollis MX1]EDQ88690.1 predicted protein [Monosiga brevicollis MX1]|eukprot:XP_001746303.1 hypothetical protein [Monosiga brevicollis MX1]
MHPSACDLLGASYLRLTTANIRVMEQSSDVTAVAHQARDDQNRIILAAISSGFSDFMYNLLASIQATVGTTRHAVVIAEDVSSYFQMEEKLPGQVLLATEDLLTFGMHNAREKLEGDKRGQSYGSTLYLLLMRARPKYLTRMHDTGVHMLFVDADIAFFENPYAWMDANLKQSYDLLASNDHANLLCAGFVYYANTSVITRFLEVWDQLVAQGDGRNQASFNKALKHPDVTGIQFYELPSSKFPHGRYYFKKHFAEMQANPPIMVHANGMSGGDRKRNALRRIGMWKPEQFGQDFVEVHDGSADQGDDDDDDADDNTTD